MMMVVVERLLLQRLGVFWGSSERLQGARELAVAAFAVGAAMARLAAVAGFPGRRGDFGAGRKRRG